ncbi:MAG TPA: PVC-type heme-binding CxxCH protein, partial [Gemmataceae bacterium]
PRTLKFEAISGTAQFGNSFDDWYNRFLCANRMVAGHVVLPSRYLARNPYLPAARVVQDCAAEGANAPLTMYQVSDAEPWREVRTKRYHDEGQKLALSEMVAKGVFTSGTGITVYRGAAYPAEYRGDAFVGNVAGNLVHRRKLTPKGATFVATRADEKREFLASTDNWFRPVNFVNAPDGTLHVLDMYREVVEHPWSIPDDIKAHLDLASGRDRGRIYRLAPPGFQLPPPPRLSDAPTGELVRQLENPNAWWRETAQRLLYERQDPAAVPALKELAEESESPLARLHALWALEGLGKLGAGEIRAALESPVPGLREHALRLAEPRLAKSPELRTLVLRLAGDPEARVRFQAALTLGEVPGEEAVERLARVARRDASDPWVRLAVLSSASGREVALLERLLLHPADGFADAGPGFTMVNALAGVIGARNQRPETDALFALAAGGKVADGVRRTLVLGLGDGLLRTGRTLQALKLDPSSPAGKLVQALLDSSARTVANEKASTAQRARAAQLLAHGRFAETRPLFEPLLDPRQPPDLQLAAVRALRNVPDREVAPLLLGGWSGYSPAVRAEVTAVLSSRPEWAAALLDAVAAKTVAPADLGPTTRATLEQHRDPEVRARARDLLRTAATTGREELIARYKEILRRPGNAERGLAVFKRECASCHYAAGVGTSVGPAIAAVGNRTPEALLTAILDPNRQIDPRYLAYTVSTLDGRILSGVITAETATTVSLRRADGASDSVLRSQIDELRSTGISLMPEGLERNIRPEEMADLLAFLASVK